MGAAGRTERHRTAFNCANSADDAVVSAWRVCTIMRMTGEHWVPACRSYAGPRATTSTGAACVNRPRQRGRCCTGAAGSLTPPSRRPGRAMGEWRGRIRDRGAFAAAQVLANEPPLLHDPLDLLAINPHAAHRREGGGGWRSGYRSSLACFVPNVSTVWRPLRSVAVGLPPCGRLRFQYRPLLGLAGDFAASLPPSVGVMIRHSPRLRGRDRGRLVAGNDLRRPVAGIAGTCRGHSRARLTRGPRPTRVAVTVPKEDEIADA